MTGAVSAANSLVGSTASTPARMTSLSRELGAVQDMDAYMDLIAELFGRIFEREPVETDRTLNELAGRAAPVR